jgi:hypothetical protein
MTQKMMAPSMPTANIAVNKSRIKLYDKNVEVPTYYLKKGQEFQIELANMTTDVVLAKITLNGKPLSQGGLVLNPGQRVFLDRYLDVAKKFLFDTYEVSNTQEVKDAIRDNGDIKVEFYRENVNPYQAPTTINLLDHTYRPDIIRYNTYTTNGFYASQPLFGQPSDNTTLTNSLGLRTSSSSGQNLTSSLFRENFSKSVDNSPLRGVSKSLETGRIEKGSDSNQELNSVNKTFYYLPFHTVTYKLLPISQKINTLEDINVKRYCTSCGAKVGKTDRFCGQCGAKA